jgi:hypothetical protein
MTLDPQSAKKIQQQETSETTLSPLRSSLSPLEWPGRKPVYPLLPKAEKNGFHELWTLRVVHPNKDHGFLLRFRLLNTENGFQRQILTQALLFSRDSNREGKVLGFKGTQDLLKFKGEDSQVLHLGDHVLDLISDTGPWSTQGGLVSRGKRLLWDFTFRPTSPASSASSWIPLKLHQGKLTRNRATTLAADWRAKGFCQVDSERWDFEEAHVEIVHEYGTQFPESWCWGHSASLAYEDGTLAPDTYFEGCTYQLRSSLGVLLPKISTFAVKYKGDIIRIDHLWASLRSRADSGHHHWKFQFDHGDLAFKGEFHAESRDFAGFSEEDTDGSIKQISTSLLAKLTLRVYRRAQLECTLHSVGGAALEFGTRNRNPYIRELF